MNTPALGHIGRYELLARLGAGGMGEVFLARVTGAGGFEKEVVIKRILPHLASDTGFVQRFIEEGKLVVKLRHAGIAQVLDMGEQEGVFFIAMEHVEGKDLGELMRVARSAPIELPRGLAVFILQEILEALDYAHRATDSDGRPLGIIHRDVSPSNLMVSTNGEVKLVDFGIARATERLQHSTTGAIRGKYGYMSPQQAAGAELDGRSDLFSAGVVAWELLTGHRPFDGASDLLTLDRVRFHDPGSIQAVADVPEDLARIIDRLLAKDPKDRWPNAAAALEGLRDYVVRTGELRGKRDLAAWVERVLQTLPRALRDRPAAGFSLDDVLKLGLGSDPARARTATVQAPLGLGLPGAAPAAGAYPTPAPSATPQPAGGTPQALAVSGTAPASPPLSDPGRAPRADSTPAPDAGTPTGPTPLLDGTTQAPAKPRGPSYLALLVVLNLILIGAVIVLVMRLSAGIDAPSGLADAVAGMTAAPTARAPDALAAATEVAVADNSPVEATIADTMAPSADTGPEVVPAHAVDPGRVAGQALDGVADRLLADASTLVIRANAKGATIAVSGFGSGPAPRTIRARAGTIVTGHASLAGYEPRSFSGVVGSEPTLTVTLRRMPRGTVQFRFFPASARVTIDGQPFETSGSNLVKTDLPEGDHTVVVTDANGKRAQRGFHVEQGKVTNLGTLDLGHGG